MTVVLEEMMGSDLAIVNNARGSLDRKTDWDHCQWCTRCNERASQICESSHSYAIIYKQMLSAADEGLLRSLAKNRHGTPFERVVYCFHIDTNIRVGREWMRHRIGSYNEMSTRYMTMGLEETARCFMPEGDAIRKNAGSRMSYIKEVITDPLVVEKVQAIMAQGYGEQMARYHQLLDLGLSQEVAAYMIPLGFRTAFYWTVNLRSVFNFLNLRNAPQALKEIRDEAVQVEQIVKETVPIAYDEWNSNGRIPI